MIWSILKKDWALLWPLAVLVTLIQIAYEWAVYKFGFFGASPIAQELMRLLTPAWLIGVVALSVAVVYEDTVPGVDQDWLIRPVQRGDLLAAKLLFVLITVSLPMLVLNVTHELALGFPVVPSLGDALYKEIYLFICLIVPAMAVASTTRDMRDLLVLVAGLVMIYATSLWLAATLFADRCPTCETSIAWLQHVLQHAAVLIGSAVILGLQYYRRRTQLSRALLAGGVVLLVLVQLPWNSAFALQSWLGAPIGSPPTHVQLAAGATQVTDGGAQVGAARGNARRATSALLQGDVDTAIKSIRSARQPSDARVILAVPLSISGITHDDILVVDHATFSLLDASGTVLYSGTGGERRSMPLVPERAAQQILQRFEVPASAYKHIAARAVSMSIDFSLTVRAVVAQHRIAAIEGEFRSPEIGICQSNADAAASFIRCRQIGHAPNCFAATLYSEAGRHNPEVLACGSDYRPFLPAPLEIISFTGVDLPVRDSYGIGHYDVDAGDLPDAYIIMKVYETGQHFRRTVVSPLQAAE